MEHQFLFVLNWSKVYKVEEMVRTTICVIT